MAIRMDPGFLGIPAPALLAHPLEFGRIDLRQAGFRPLTMEDHVQVPNAEGFGADLSSRLDVDFVRSNSFGTAELLGGFVFDDPHADKWWDGIHSRGALVVVVADPALWVSHETTLESTEALISAGAMVGDVSLVIKAYSDGVGTRPAD